MLAIAQFRGTAPPRRLTGRQAAALATISLAVIAAASYRVATTWRQTPPASPRQVIQQAASSSAAMTSATASFSTQVSGLTVLFGTVREQRTPSRVATLSMTAVDGVERFSVTEVVTTSNVYVSMPALAEAVGRPWLGVPVPQLTAYPALAALYQTNAIPTAAAGLLTVVSRARVIGTGKFRGVPVTRYAAAVDPAVALATLDPVLRQLLAPELQSATGEIGFTLWIDAEDNFRKIRSSAVIGGRRTVTTIIVTDGRRGRPIAVPAASEVAMTTGDPRAS